MPHALWAWCAGNGLEEWSVASYPWQRGSGFEYYGLMIFVFFLKDWLITIYIYIHIDISFLLILDLLNTVDALCVSMNIAILQHVLHHLKHGSADQVLSVRHLTLRDAVVSAQGFIRSDSRDISYWWILVPMTFCKTSISSTSRLDGCWDLNQGWKNMQLIFGVLLEQIMILTWTNSMVSFFASRWF